MVEAITKVTNEGYAKTDVEEVDNGLQKTQLRPKPRKWKLQAKIQKTGKRNTNGSVSLKRPNNEFTWSSPENKKRRMLSPAKVLNLQNQLSPSQTKRQLKLVDAEEIEVEDAAANMENTLAGASSQPRQQP